MANLEENESTRKKMESLGRVVSKTDPQIPLAGREELHLPQCG